MECDVNGQRVERPCRVGPPLGAEAARPQADDDDSSSLPEMVPREGRLSRRLNNDSDRAVSADAVKFSNETRGFWPATREWETIVVKGLAGVAPQACQVWSPVSAGHCNTELVGRLMMVREQEGVDAGSSSVVGGA